jgi:hypothetical protein
LGICSRFKDLPVSEGCYCYQFILADVNQPIAE